MWRLTKPMMTVIIISFLWTITGIAQQASLMNQKKWHLSGGQGKWQSDPITGETCLTVSGTGKEGDSNYWTLPYAFMPNRMYRISCQVRTSPGAIGANILTGTSLANRDVWVSHTWEKKEFIFQAPVKTDGAYLRFGQWQVNGTVWFRDVQVGEVQPVYRTKRDYTLGAGEIIQKGHYRASFNFQGIESNSSHCTLEHQAWFNSNRLVLGSGDYIIFQHRPKANDQLKGDVSVNIGYHVSGKCTIEASHDLKKWRLVGSLNEKGEKSYPLPSALYPSEVIYLRLKAEGLAANFQIFQYDYQTQIRESIPGFVGSTQWADVLESSDQMAIRMESIGSSGADGVSPAVIQLENKSNQEQTYEVQIESERKVEMKVVTLAAKSSKKIELQIDDPEITAEKKTVTVKRRGDRQAAFRARADIQIPYIQRSDYGQLLGKDKTAAVWWTDGMRKIGQDRPAPGTPISPEIDLSAAKNEYEPVQLVIRPRETLANVSVKLSPLQHANGGTLQTDILMVEYVFIQHPTDGTGLMEWWPDPLPSMPKTFTVQAGKNQPLWMLIHVPADAQPGDYRGTITVSASTWQKKIPIRMHVWNFTLPRQNHLQSSLGFEPSLIARYHRYTDRDDLHPLLEKYFKNFAEHRLSPYDPFVNDRISEQFDKKNLKAKLNFTKFDEGIPRYFDQYGFNSFRLNVQGLGSGTYHSRQRGEIVGLQQGSGQYSRLMSDYLGQIQDHFEKQGILDKAYIYWFDEPAEKDYEFVKETMDFIGKSAPKLTRMLTEQPVEPLYGSVDLWCPMTSDYDHAIAEKRRTAGDRFWWYICTTPKEPYCTLFIDHYAVELRTWIWQTWKYNIEGILIWQTNYWTSDPVYPLPKKQNPYEDPMSYRSGYDTGVGEVGYWGNGDGRFIYPPRAGLSGRTRCDEGPVSSMRWEILREGMEDYEYFWLLRDLIKKVSAKKGKSSLIGKAKVLLNVPENVTSSLTTFSKSPEPIFEHRAKMAEMIEQLQKEL